MKTLQDQLKAINETLGDVKVRSAGYVMPFGKHKGKDLSDIPLFYITWVITNIIDDNELINQCELEIERRN